MSDLEGRGYELEKHNLLKETPSRELLGQLIDEYGLESVLSRRSPAFKALGDRKLSKKEAIELMMADANLIRRPLLMTKKKVIFGYDKEEYGKL